MTKSKQVSPLRKVLLLLVAACLSMGGLMAGVAAAVQVPGVYRGITDNTIAVQQPYGDGSNQTAHPAPLVAYPDGNAGAAEVVYCFNMNRTIPSAGDANPDGTNLQFDKFTGEALSGYADNARAGSEQGVLDVLYNGFPNDNSGLQDALALTDNEYRYATQLAVWYWTDSADGQYLMDATANFQKIEEAYKMLTRQAPAPVTLQTAPAGMTLEIYKEATGRTDMNYQSLVGITFVPLDGYTPPVVTPSSTPTPQPVTFSKVDLGGSELPGASIEVKNAAGTVVESWTSTETPHVIAGLTEGTYTFHEVAAPTGYVAVTDITFTVAADGSVTVTNTNGNTVTANGSTLTVTDQAEPTPSPTPTPQPVTFSKVDLGGSELPGASIEVKNAAGTVVESWTSTETPHVIAGLTEGTYTFHEVAAPTGYVAVTDITFTVAADGSVTVTNTNGNTVTANGSTLTVTDQSQTYPVSISKVDIAGAELPGASITVSKIGGTQTDSWISTSTPHQLTLVPGDYIFHEEAAPNGYQAVTDITFTVELDGKVTVKDAAGNGVTVGADGKTLIVTDQPTPTPSETPTPSVTPTPSETPTPSVTPSEPTPTEPTPTNDVTVPVVVPTDDATTTPVETPTPEATPTEDTSIPSAEPSESESPAPEETPAPSETAAPAASLELDKRAALDDANGNGYGDVGEVITYTFVVTNTGNTDVTNIRLDDEMFQLKGAACAAVLKAGETVTCETVLTYAITAADIASGRPIVNTANVFADGVEGATTSQDSVEVPVLPLMAVGEETSAPAPAASTGRTLPSTGSEMSVVALAAGVVSALAGGALVFAGRRKDEE